MNSINREVALLAGVVSEPSASPPREMGLYPAATAIADPVDEPPGLYMHYRLAQGMK